MSGALGKSGWAEGARTVGAPYGARYTISHNRMPLDRIPLCMPSVVVRIDYPLSAIRYPLLSYNSLFQANPSRPIRELAAAGPQLPAV
jgi:hypothetical protein